MNCLEFHEIVQDLARQGQPRSEDSNPGTQRQREDALDHARVCAGCDEALAQAVSLTAGLRTLAGSYARAEAPAHMEKKLLAAYRQSHATVKPMLARWGVPTAVTGLAVAAALAIAIVWYRPSYRPIGHVIFSHAISPAARASPFSPPPTTAQNVTEQNPRTRQDTPRTAIARSSVTPSRGLAADGASQNQSSFEDISATSGTFMPLPYAEEGPIENATVVRAVLPGTELGAFGLPVTDGAAEGKVVADFIVGEDGTPEAIRIVR
jgi:hypothetical protein